MKRKSLVTLLLSTFLLCSCGSEPSYVDKSLTKIKLSGDYQTSFTIGEEFNYDGLIVTAYYSDSTYKEVNNYVVSSPNMNKVGSQSVTVTYIENSVSKSTYYAISISEVAPITPTLVSISLSGSYRTDYQVGDTFSYSGLIVTASYSNGNSKVVSDYTVSTPNMSIVGSQSVTVAYSENNITKSTSYLINISNVEVVTLSSISLSGTYQTTFEYNETFNYSGLVVTAKYSDGSSKVVTSYTVSTPSMTTTGTQSVTVTYKENNISKSASYNITVKEEIIELETIYKEPYLGKQVYLNHIGDIFTSLKSYRGKGITIAVIDSAFDTTHEEFVNLDGSSKISDKSASFTYNGSKVVTQVGKSYAHDLSDSHGTFCAGVVGAALNHKGVIGVAPEATLMLLKTDKKPKSIVEAFKYAADNGAKVITISIGSYNGYGTDGDLINDGSDLTTVFNDSVSYCRSKGVAVISAGGNGGGTSKATEYTYPGATTGVIGCGGLAFNSNETIWSGSSYNYNTSSQFIDVFAPSEQMFNICNFYRDGVHYTYDGGWEGTSFASPIVAGLAALYFEKNPNKTVSEFETSLFNSCHKLNHEETHTLSQLGNGRVDALKLLGLSNDYEVTIKIKTNWSSCYVYAFNSDLSLENELASWPGVKLSKTNNYYTYKLTVSDYDTIVIHNNSGTQTIDILASSFNDGYIYDITSNYSINNRLIGNYIYS